MPTQDYRNKAGERIPGNTTIIGQNLGWSKGALMYWAWDQGRNGKDFRDTKESAADVGTLAHEMIEKDIKGQPLPDLSKLTKEQQQQVETAYLNFLEWRKGVTMELVSMETPIVCESLQYGTTIDVLARVNGKLVIVEAKTSNGVYEDYLIQLAAQKYAWDETHPEEKIQGLHILRVNKDSGAFTHHYWESLPGCLEAFMALRELHDLKKAIKKLT